MCVWKFLQICPMIRYIERIYKKAVYNKMFDGNNSPLELNPYLDFKRPFCFQININCSQRLNRQINCTSNLTNQLAWLLNKNYWVSFIFKPSVYPVPAKFIIFLKLGPISSKLYHTPNIGDIKKCFTFLDKNAFNNFIAGQWWMNNSSVSFFFFYSRTFL